MTRLLASVRDADEALAAAAAGADFIDLKDPAAGALGALPCARIAALVALLRERYPGVPVSATTGDWPPGVEPRHLARVMAVARCGVDYVKVGVAPGRASLALLDALAASGAPAVPVLLADDGVDGDLLDHAVRLAAFPALMLDLAGKRHGSLLERLAPAALAHFVRTVQASGRLAGVAGALRAADVPALHELAPDFAGFRSALCAGSRASALDPARVRDLVAPLARGQGSRSFDRSERPSTAATR